MPTAPIPENESERLAALAEYQAAVAHEALDFSSIVELTAQLFNVPIALVTFVERNRQTFQAKVGISHDETNRHHSFCAHALGIETLMVVLDASKDARFSDNPLVTGPPHVRFYAGAPLLTLNGFVLGTLCILDSDPRQEFSIQDRNNLQSFARLVIDKLETHRLSVANRRSKSRFESIAQTSPDGIICADSNGKITFWNQASKQLFGFDAESAIGRNIDIIIPQGARGGHDQGLRRAAQGGETRLLGKTIELDATHKNGHEFPVELSLSMWTEQGNACFGAIIRDISARRADSKQMFNLAYLDGLTRVPNRHALMERIGELLSDRKPFALLMLDLDGFKEVNDTLGHQAGDEVLRQVAARLIQCVDSTHTFSRLGGDEFAVLIPESGESGLVSEVAAAILAALAVPLNVENRLLHITCSIGAASFPAHGEKTGDLLSAADLAMYQAKAEGRNRLHFFTPTLRQALIDKRSLEDELRHAVAQEEFELFYQPQVRISDGAVLGAESLLRWHHPREGTLSPARFLLLIDSGPHAVTIGRWAMLTACAQAAEFRKLLPNLVIGLNLFAAQFHTGTLVNDTVDALAQFDLPSSALELEITENMILKDDGLILNQLHQLRDMGVRIAFDDFGTGYASFSLLKEYPVTRLKIDRSFISDICNDPADAAIVDAVINMAQKLKLGVIAEGVENAEQKDFLRKHRCDVVQGYFFGEPMPNSKFEIFIKSSISKTIA